MRIGNYSKEIRKKSRGVLAADDRVYLTQKGEEEYFSCSKLERHVLEIVSETPGISLRNVIRTLQREGSKVRCGNLVNLLEKGILSTKDPGKNYEPVLHKLTTVTSTAGWAEEKFSLPIDYSFTWNFEHWSLEGSIDLNWFLFHHPKSKLFISGNAAGLVDSLWSPPEILDAHPTRHQLTNLLELVYGVRQTHYFVNQLDLSARKIQQKNLQEL